MTNNQLTRERIELIANFHRAMTLPPSHDEIEELARMALAAMDSEPVAWLLTDPEFGHSVATRAGYTLNWYRSKGWDITPLYRHAQPAPVVPDEMLCEFYEVANWPDLVRELVKHVEQLQDSAKRNVKPWEDTFPETLLPAYIDRVKQADDACRAAMLHTKPDCTCPSGDGSLRWPCPEHPRNSPAQDGNSPAHSGLRPEQSGVSPACTTSREHFISLCNEFWNWSEMDQVCADDRGYELRMEWDGKVFKHPVTQALWRMYQAAPAGIPMIPDGYVMVPKEPTKEMIDAGWLYFMGAKSPSSKGAYKAMLAAAPQPQNEPQNIPEIIPQWIPVSERIPETDGNYWGWWSESKRQGPVWFIKSELQAQFQSHEITHWMPLPAAPQEVDHG